MGRRIVVYALIGLLALVVIGRGECVFADPPAPELAVTVRKVIGDTIVDQIIWDDDTITPGETDWYRADVYLEITFVNLPLYNDWGIQVFTDNTNKQALRFGPPYLYNGTYVIDPNPQGPPDTGDIAGDFSAGLVHEGGKHTLPMCWRVVLNKISPEDIEEELSIVEVEDIDQETGWHHLRRTNSPDDNYNCWIWMRDMAFDGWSNPIELWGWLTPNPDIAWSYESPNVLYPTIVCEQGIQHAEMDFGGWGPNGPENYQTVYLYLGAKFKKAAGGDYKTKIYIQMYHF